MMPPALVPLLRIAWRDARRNRARSLLVVAMIALPVLGISAGSVLLRTNALTDDDRATRVAGAADLRLDVVSGGGAETILARLPDGARAVAVEHSSAQFVADGQRTWISALGLPLGDPMLEGFVALLEGEPPTSPREAAVSPALLRAAGARVGDTIELTAPAVAVVVTGVAVRPYDTREALVVLAPGTIGGPDWYGGDESWSSTTWLVQTPGHDPSRVRELLGAASPFEVEAEVVGAWGSADAAFVQTRAELGSVEPVENQGLSLVFVVGGLALFEAALMAAAAFAVGARRQLRALGLVAATGGERRHVMGVVLSSGVVLGVAGALAGVLGGVGLAVGLLPSMDRLAGRLHADLRLPLLELAGAAALGVLAAVLAAWVPARTASRVPVMEALAGRRPIRSGRPAVTAAGVVAVALGAGVAAWGARPPSSTGSVLLGAVLVVAGFAAASPALVALLGRPARRAPTSVRLALRDAARHRTRTGPAVAAIMAALSLPVALAAFALSTQARAAAAHTPLLGDDQVLVQTSLLPGEEPGADLGASALAAIQRLLPGSTVAELRVAELAPVGAAAPAPRPDEADGPAMVWVEGAWRDDHRLQSSLAVGDESLLRAMGGSAGLEAFRAGEVVALGLGLTDGGSVDVTAWVAESSTLATLPAVEVDRPHYQLLPRFLISASAARDLGLDSAVQGGLVLAPQPLTPDQRAAVHAAVAAADPLAFAQVEAPYWQETTALVRLGLALCALIALGIVAIATALNLTEARDDLATLAAVGASPRIRRTLTGVQAATLAAIGGILAVPAGLVPVTAVLFTRRDADYPIVVPWLAIAVVVVVVPLLSGAGGALLARSRVVRRRRLA